MSTDASATIETGSDDEFEARYRRDREFLRERGRNTEPPRADDIRCLEDLDACRGGVVKYTKDQGITWRYALVSPLGPEHLGREFGFSATAELMPNVQVHKNDALTERDFANGMVVRIADLGELEGLEFGYGHKPESHSHIRFVP